MNILIFDFEITGHHSEYIDHLVRFISQDQNNTHIYYFVVHPDFCKRSPDLVNIAPKLKIKFVTITNSELKEIFIQKRNNSQDEINPYKIYDLLIHYANTIKPDKCILMYFNVFLKPLIFKRPKFLIYGILFSPFVRSNTNLNMRTKFKYLRRWILTFLYTRNNKIKKIFVLNDKTVAQALNKQIKKKVFWYLPDPIPQIEEETNYNIRNIFNIEQQKKILLHFGSLRDSKGTVELIQSLNLLSNRAASKCCLIIAGRPKNSNIENQIHENINKVKKVQIIYIKKFVSNAKMKSFFKQSDIILMPYKNGQASSGVIGHAIAAEKPVISTQHGLIGEIIKYRWKGELLESIEPKSIARAIEKSIFTVYSEVNNYTFVKDHTPFNFAKTILEF